MSIFAESLGLYDPDLSDPVVAEAYAEGVAAFLRGGFRLALRDWADLAPAERAVWALVGDQLAAKHAVQIGRAARSAAGEAEVMALLDGGDALVSVELARFMDAQETR